MEQKKNKHFIIPPSYFKARGITPVPIQKKTETVQAKTLETQEVKRTAEKVKTEIQPSKSTVSEPSTPKLSINNPNKVTSGLSLKSIKEKKEHHIRQMNVVIDENDLPSEPVTQEALNKAWRTYTAKMDENGEKILASILQMDEPTLKGTTIYLTYSNNTNKIELERAEFPLMAYLKKTLLNFDLKLDITVNEEEAKKYAFTPIEKYEKLKAKNPNIELLRKTFGLDI